ncbi:unnamed protein product [Caenorhabditis auriculariae]|uniref:Phosphoenolpyruvate carboxykinase [GTP] n=1 Tax=Caenorhabditis auriculariae TaxID=2777116 RepID=A0A8S1HN60_9PELO|nr:unnamed protein product [Caenorhabditis auriculariae]
MLETDCPECVCEEAKVDFAPKPESVTSYISTRNSTVATTLTIRGLGKIPVYKGDPTWISPKIWNFISEKAVLMRPSAIRICNGSWHEAHELSQILKNKGLLEEMTSLENVYVARTDPSDTMRVEKNTFIVTNSRSEVQPNRTVTISRAKNFQSMLAQWMSPKKFVQEADERFPGCMRGRTMYVIPFSMGPIGGRFSKNAVQLTDSPYVVINMRVVARVSSSVWDAIGNGDFVKCVHSVGVPRPVLHRLKNNWACNTSDIFIAHILEESEIWSYGSGYGGNSLLGKKCLALRMGSYMGLKDGWLAEHAAIISITDPQDQEIFVCVSFPSGAGKTTMSAMLPALPGWKIKVLGDDIAWIRWKDGQMFAMAPENGMFGIAADVKEDSGKILIEALKRDALVVNCATTSKGRLMWQGIEGTLEPEETVVDWRGETWTKDSKSFRPPAHPNCRFTVYTSNVANVHPKWDSPCGVPISAYIFGSRRPDAYPLVLETNNWAEGVLLATGMRSKVGSGTDRKSDGLVNDPMSMRPFMAYNFGKYVDHWLEMGKNREKVPKIFHVNWYQEDDNGNVIWPGFNENIRVLEWIFNRVRNPTDESNVSTSVIGKTPKSLNMDGLPLKIDLKKLCEPPPTFWLKEMAEIRSFVNAEMGDDKPQQIEFMLHELAAKL